MVAAFAAVEPENVHHARASSRMQFARVFHDADAAIETCAAYVLRGDADAMGLCFAANHAAAAALSVVDGSDSESALALYQRSRACAELLEAGGVGTAGDREQLAGACIALAAGAVDAMREQLEHVGGLMGDPASDAASLAAQATAVAQIQAQLGGALTAPGQLQTVISAYTGLPAAQASSVASLAGSIMSGQAPSLATLAPLIAGGLALAGVGAPLIAAVAAAIPLVSALLAALGIVQGPPTCTFKVGGLCFQETIPYGPIDPSTGKPNAQWTTFAAFVGKQGAPTSPTAGLQGNQVAIAFPYYWLMARELPTIDAVLSLYQPPAKLQPSGGLATTGGLHRLQPGAPTTFSTPAAPAPKPPPGPQLTSTTLIWLFLRTYYTAWQANAEQAINGHPYASDAQLLTAVVGAWNQTHASSSTYVFQPAQVDVLHAPPVSPGVDLTDPAFPTFVAYLLSGQLDGRAQPPLTINVGPAVGSSAATAPAAPGATTSTATVAVVAAAAVGAAGAAWLGLFGSGVSEALKALVGAGK